MAIAPPPAASRWSRPSRWLIGAGVGVVAIVAFLVTQLLSSTASAETADLSGQGGEGVWAADGATLTPDSRYARDGAEHPAADARRV